jgi:hypothetical protein
MFNPTEDCKASVNIPQTTGPDLIIPGGKYYGLCPCDKTVCPVGYDYTFPNFSAFTLNPIDNPSTNPINNSIALNNLSNKKCGDIAGIVPTDKSMWKQDVFDGCVKLYNLQDTININEKNITPINTIYQNSTKKYNGVVENFTDTSNINDYTSMYGNNNGLQKRITSFNTSLGDRVQKDYSYLQGQVSSTEEMQRVNSRWNSVIDDMNEMDRQVTNEIQVKARLTEINEDDSRQKNNTIMLILGAFITIFIFVFSGFGYLAGKISLRNMFILFFVGVLIFLMIAISLNKYTIKEFKKSNKLEKEILHKGDELNIKALQWVDDNCECPNNSNNLDPSYKNQKTQISYNKMMEHQKYDNDSIYYDDGTLKHKITPSDFARETGVLPCDVNDGDNLNDDDDINKAKNNLNMVT